mgnify:CR=1 FL=1
MKINLIGSDIMRVKYIFFIFFSMILILSSSVLASGLEIQGGISSQLEVGLNEDAEIEEFDNQLTLELSHYNSNSGLFKGSFKYNSSIDEIELTELYSELYFPSVDLTIGKQRIAWGKADGINPTDYFNPEDFTDPFAEENKINIAALRAKKYYQDWVFDLVWSPIFEANKLPQPDSRWYPEGESELMPGYSQVLKETIEPERTLKNSQIGLRISRWSGSIDASLSYYYGWRKDPTIYTTVDESNNQIIIQPEYNRLQGIGADFAKPIGKYVLRGEAAYFITADEDIKNDYFEYVLGVDFNVTDDLYINTQFFGDKEKEIDPQNGITLAVEYSINEFNQIELNTIYRFEGEEIVINPVYSNDIMDGVNLSLGAYLFDGNKAGGFEQFVDKDYMYIELNRAF